MKFGARKPESNCSSDRRKRERVVARTYLDGGLLRDVLVSASRVSLCPVKSLVKIDGSPGFPSIQDSRFPFFLRAQGAGMQRLSDGRWKKGLVYAGGTSTCRVIAGDSRSIGSSTLTMHFYSVTLQFTADQSIGDVLILPGFSGTRARIASPRL